MCDPVTMGLAAGASAGGALLKNKEANDNAAAMTDARNRATQAELERQRVYGGESRDIFGGAMDRFTPQAQADNLASGQADATRAFQSNLPVDVGSITTARAPAVVGNSENRKIADVFGRLGAEATAHGNLQGYDTANTNNKFALADSGRRIDTIGDFAKVSSGINQKEQDASYKNAYKPGSGVGDLLSTAGQLGAFYAGKGGSLPFMSVFNNGGAPMAGAYNVGSAAGRP